MNNYDAVRSAIGDADASTPVERRKVYRRLTDDLQRQIAASQPAFRNSLTVRLRNLRQAIQEFEQDFVAGTLRAPLPVFDRPAPDPAVSMVLSSAPRAHPLGRLRTIVALTLRFLRHLSRIGPAAALWIVVEPILQMGIIITVYSLLGAASILDMDPFPFVVLGVGSWFMFRMIMLRSAIMPFDRGLILIPRVRLTDIVISRAIAYSIIYTWALFFFMTIVELTGRGSEIDNLLAMVIDWISIILLAIGFGLFIRGLSDHMPAMVRIVPWISRIFFYTSGIVYVTEQLPDFISKFLLFNPLLHSIQSLRANFFVAYETNDVSIIYSYCWAVVLITLGLTMQAERLSRHR